MRTFVCLLAFLALSRAEKHDDDHDDLQNRINAMLGNQNKGPPGVPGMGNPFKNLDGQLDQLEALINRIGNMNPGDSGMPDMKGPFPGGFPGGFPPIPNNPFLAILAQDLEPAERLNIPEFFPQVDVFEGYFYDSMDFTMLRPYIENGTRELLRQYAEPEEAVRHLPELYKTKMECTINVLQRLVKLGLRRWADRTMTELRPELPAIIVNAAREEILNELDRAIFGQEFEEFEGTVHFIARALEQRETNNTIAEIPGVVFKLASKLMQCTDRNNFLQGLLSRIPRLNQRLVTVSPYPLAIRIIQRLPRPCTAGPPVDPRVILPRIFAVTARILPVFQSQLRDMLEKVREAIVKDTYAPILDILTDLMDEPRANLLRLVIERLRRPGPGVVVVPNPPPVPANDSANPFLPNVNDLPSNVTGNQPVPPPGLNITNPLPSAGNNTNPLPSGGNNINPGYTNNGTSPTNGTNPTTERLITLLKRLVDRKRALW